MDYDTVYVTKVNEVYIKVTADSGIKQELNEYFSFFANNYKFHPKYKAKIWDGLIRLYNPMKPVLYAGLLEQLKKFCNDREYALEIQDGIEESQIIDDSYPEQLATEIGAKHQLRDYQIKYILNCIRTKRSVSLSPTSSGKSFIIYMLQQHYYRTAELRTLIIVPNIGLVNQMYGDFVDYGTEPENLYKIQGGVDKNTKGIPTVISTWQSLIKQPKEWFDQFQVVIGDECHLFEAKCLVNIMEKLDSCPYRFGFTGTLSSESKVGRLVLEGLFGPVKKYISTDELIQQGYAADLKVKALVLQHTKENRDIFRANINKIDVKKRYHAEKLYISNHEKRNKFLCNLIWSLEGQNNLILFDLVEKHGKILHPLLEREGRILHFIHGGVSGDEREAMRHQIENDTLKRHDILASYGTTSTGINIRRLDNIIFASGFKSEIKVLQSIGRSLRKGNGADNACIYDIADDLSNRSYQNYTLKHFKKRLEIYNIENFPVKIYNIDLH